MARGRLRRGEREEAPGRNLTVFVGAGWEPVGGFLSVLRVIALVSRVLLVIALVPRLRKVFGLFERGFLLSTNLWFLTVGICLLVEAA
ncbi:hypothetical protein EV651_114195 [Kribbella sp. VKM Ac-2571]|nr:hypothetical protein EV651_114195 [Kribbella sp. VKM Ac-2571]